MGVAGAGVGAGADLQPEMSEAARIVSANGATEYQRGAKPLVWTPKTYWEG